MKPHFHRHDDVIWNIGFGQQDVHMSRKSTCHGVNREAHRLPESSEVLRKLSNNNLRSASCHSISTITRPQ